MTGLGKAMDGWMDTSKLPTQQRHSVSKGRNGGRWGTNKIAEKEGVGKKGGRNHHPVATHFALMPHCDGVTQQRHSVSKGGNGERSGGRWGTKNIAE